MNLIKDLKQDTQLTPELIRQEKLLSMISLKIMKYVYSKHKNGEIRQAYEDYLSDESQTLFAEPSVEEQRVKNFIKNFDKHFDEYENVPCFSILKGFNNSKENATDSYLETSKETRTFDLSSYMNMLSDKNGNLKSSRELETLPKETTLQMADSILSFAKIADDCAVRSGSSFGLGLSR